MTVSHAPHASFDTARRPLRTPRPESHVVNASDGVPLRLTRYRGGSRGPVLLAHGLSVSSRIFSTDTIETNLVEFLCAHGFDVWLVELRVSIELPASRLPWTADEIATKDFPAAVAAIRFITGATAVDALVHCWGATAFFMSMLAGLAGVRSIVSSQVGLHAFVAPRLRLESLASFATLLRLAGLPALSARPGEQRNTLQRAYDAALVMLPTSPSERCDSPTCRRISFLYSRLYQHENLAKVTHDALPELFGVVSLRSLEHVATIFRRGHLVSADGRNDYMPHIGRLAVPTTFIHGALNQCYRPASTAATFELLSGTNGASFYRHHVVPGYGHIDCIIGKNAARDVFPLMLRHFDRVAS